jgi:hypothetical protein
LYLNAKESLADQNDQSLELLGAEIFVGVLHDLMAFLRKRRSIEALGGKLSLVAEFPDRDPVVIAGIGSLDG